MSDFRITANREGGVRNFGGRGGNNRGGNSRGNRGAPRGYGSNRGNANYDGGYGGGYSSNRGSGANSYKSRPRRQSRNNYSGRMSNRGALSRLGDEDEDMGDQDTRKTQLVSRYKPYGGRPRGSRNSGRGGAAMDNPNNSALSRLGLPISSSGRDRLQGNSDSRWKIIIPHAQSSGQDFIIKSIRNLCKVPFVPENFRFEIHSAVFYVDSKRTADALCSISRRITKRDGFKMLILSQPGRPAQTAPPLNEDTITKLKVCMSKRYDPATKTLNLKDLYYDTDLHSAGIRASLGKRNFMTAVINIIKENIPELMSLSLASNKLYSIELMSSLRKAAPDLVGLDLSDNILRAQSHLEGLSGMNLVELRLNGNPVASSFGGDNTEYVSAVRKKLPKLTRLDDNELPPVITFDIDTVVKLPATKGSFFPSEPVKTLICSFLQQYYAIYDSGNRSALHEAYHEQVTFSMTCTYSRSSSRDQSDFALYQRSSRNLKKLPDASRRQKNLLCGRSHVMAFLSDLPATRHDPASYVIDVSLASATMLNFTLHGLFEEVGGKSGKGPVRAFSRLFVAIPQGSGVAIINEELFITNPTSKQLENAFKSPAVTPVASPAPGSITVSPVGGSTDVMTDEQKYKMIQQFSLQSGMTNDWAKMCLLQNAWNYDAAAQVFADLKTKGNIPSEAFVK